MTEPTLIELKAAAYDCLVQVEAWQLKLKQANEAIAQRVQADARPKD